ncbi:MAG: hypothetical protein IPH85_13830 [Ignavibacteria bacterium]|nr:hypothetical protein [Ignavibacteria bacterium]
MNYEKLNDILNRAIMLRTEAFAKAAVEFDEKVKPLQEECGIETGHNFAGGKCTACGATKVEKE